MKKRTPLQPYVRVWLRLPCFYSKRDGHASLVIWQSQSMPMAFIFNNIAMVLQQPHDIGLSAGLTVACWRGQRTESQCSLPKEPSLNGFLCLDLVLRAHAGTHLNTQTHKHTNTCIHMYTIYRPTVQYKLQEHVAYWKECVPVPRRHCHDIIYSC